MTHVQFGQMAWPAVTSDVDEVQYRMRYGQPSRSDLLVAASVMSAYKALVLSTQSKRAMVVRNVKRLSFANRAATPNEAKSEPRTAPVAVGSTNPNPQEPSDATK